MKHSSVRAEVEHSSVRAEVEHSSVRVNIEQSSVRANMEHSSVRAEVEHSSARAEVEHSSVRTEVEHLSVRAEVEHSSVRAEVEHLSVRAEVEHSSVRAEVEQLSPVGQLCQSTIESPINKLTTQIQFIFFIIYIFLFLCRFISFLTGSLTRFGRFRLLVLFATVTLVENKNQSTTPIVYISYLRLSLRYFLFNTLFRHISCTLLCLSRPSDKSSDSSSLSNSSCMAAQTAIEPTGQ